MSVEIYALGNAYYSGFFAYNEASSAHLRDYTAHQVLAVVNLRW